MPGGKHRAGYWVRVYSGGTIADSEDWYGTKKEALAAALGTLRGTAMLQAREGATEERIQLGLRLARLDLEGYLSADVEQFAFEFGGIVSVVIEEAQRLPFDPWTD